MGDLVVHGRTPSLQVSEPSIDPREVSSEMAKRARASSGTLLYVREKVILWLAVGCIRRSDMQCNTLTHGITLPGALACITAGVTCKGLFSCRAGYLSRASKLKKLSPRQPP